jgi:cold shock CspA family protein
MARTCTWDKAQLEDDSELEFLLEQTDKPQWESESTHASQSDSDYHQSLLSERWYPDTISALVHKDRPQSPSDNGSEEGWSEIVAWAEASHSQPLELVDASLEAIMDRTTIGASRPLPPWLQRRSRKGHRDESTARSRTEPCTNVSPRQASNTKIDAISSRADVGADATFLGVWGPASITQNSLTWNEGDTVRIEVLSEIQFRMAYFDQQGAQESFVAELRSNGTLHWSDGDALSRPKILQQCSQVGLRKELEDETTSLSETDLRHFDEINVSDREHNKADNESRAIVSSEAVVILPPWLKRRPRKKCREELVALPKREPVVRCLDSAKVQIASDPHSKQANRESHENNATTGVVRSSTLVDMSVVTWPTQRDAQLCSRDRDCNNSATYTHLNSSSVSVASTRARASARACQNVSLAGPFQGKVKWFRGSFGWIDSTEAKNAYSGSDVFLHVSDCDFKPRQGDEIEFHVDFDDRGNPKAVRATQKRTLNISRSSIEMINGRDYFADRDAKLEMRKRR